MNPNLKITTHDGDRLIPTTPVPSTPPPSTPPAPPADMASPNDVALQVKNATPTQTSSRRNLTQDTSAQQKTQETMAESGKKKVDDSLKKNMIIKLIQEGNVGKCVEEMQKQHISTKFLIEIIQYELEEKNKLMNDCKEVQRDKTISRENKKEYKDFADAEIESLDKWLKTGEKIVDILNKTVHHKKS